MGTLHLAFLGTPEVRHPDQLLRFPSRKALALLLYLVVEGGVHPRVQLASLFWPESEAPRSQAALRRTLVYLRQALQEEATSSPQSHLCIAHETLGFNATSAYTLDVQALSHAFQDVRASSRAGTLQGEARASLVAQLQKAVEQYRGGFLDGFFLEDAPDFEDWTRLQRAVWQQRMNAVFDRLSQLQLDGGELPDALETASRWTLHDPLQEAAYRRLMLVQVASGERTAALQTYDTCRRLLAQELRTTPAPETEALAERLRAQWLPPRQSSGRTLAPAPQGSSAPAPLSLLSQLPLVGRASEFSTLVARYAATQGGHAQIVILQGEAGIGKTRLAQEFVGWASAHGADVLQGRSFETGGLLPYQTLVDALRARIERENAPDDLLADVWLKELSRLLPELRERYPDLPLPAGDEATGRIRLFEAVARVGQALAERSPVVLFLDDFHWADAASLDLLHYAGRRWREGGAPLLVLVSLRTETVRLMPALAAWLSGLEHDLPVTRLPLKALTVEETLHLVQGLGGEGRAPRRREHPSSQMAAGAAPSISSLPLIEAFGRWLFAESGGQPFYVLELLKVVLERGLLAPALQEDGSWGLDFTEAASEIATLQGVVPPGVRDVIRTRLERLAHSAVTLVAAGAVLGQEATFEVLCQVAGLGEPEGLAALEEAITAHVLREVPQVDRRSFNSTYGFTHDKIRDVAYTEAGEARRQVLHRRALEVLQARAAPAAQLAYHARASGRLEAAVRWSLAAGDEAWRLFANVLAKRQYAEALESLAQLPATAETRRQRVDTLLKKALIASLLDPSEQTLAQLAEAEALLRSLPPVEASSREARRSLAQLHFLLGRTHDNRNEKHQAEQYFRQARAEAQAVEAEDLVSVTSSMLGRVLATKGYMRQARLLLTEALLPLERAANWIEYVLTLGYLGDVLAACGQYREGLRTTQQALTVAQEKGDFAAAAFAPLHVAFVHFLGGEAQLTLEASRAVVQRAEEPGDWVRAYVGYGLCAWAEHQLGQPEAALASMAHQQALAQRLGEQRLILADWFAAIHAEIVLSAQRVDEALTLAEAAVTYAQAVDGKWAEGLAHRVWAQALAALTPPRWDEVEKHLAAGLQAFEAGEMLPEIARTHRIWGVLCRDHHELPAAQAHLDQASTLFEACGLTAERERILQL